MPDKNAKTVGDSIAKRGDFQDILHTKAYTWHITGGHHSHEKI